MSRKNRKNKENKAEEQFLSAERAENEENPEAPAEAEEKPAHEKRRSADVIEELFSELDKETDIESDVADLGTEEDDGTIVAPDPRKRKFFFGFAIFIVIMALIGIFASVRFIVGGIGSLMENKTLKDEFTRFLLPVAANDIAPFGNESEVSQLAKVGCSIWNILLNKDISSYKKPDSSELIIPEYDVAVSCKELFGANAQIEHQSTGSADTRFIYNATNHVYTCTYNLRYLSYTPRIAHMDQSQNTYTLTVEYIPPSISVVSQNIGMEVSPEKTLLYTVKRESGANTLLSVAEKQDG